MEIHFHDYLKYTYEDSCISIIFSSTFLSGAPSILPQSKTQLFIFRKESYLGNLSVSLKSSAASTLSLPVVIFSSPVLSITKVTGVLHLSIRASRMSVLIIYFHSSWQRRLNFFIPFLPVVVDDFGIVRHCVSKYFGASPGHDMALKAGPAALFEFVEAVVQRVTAVI